MEFTRKEFDAFRKDMEKAMKSLEKKYKVDIHAGSLSYDQTKFTVKVDCTKSDIGDVKKMEFESMCEWFGFKKSDYNKKFKDKGKTYRLVGFKPKARKNNIIVYCETDGQEYVCSEELVRRLIKNK